ALAARIHGRRIDDVLGDDVLRNAINLSRSRGSARLTRFDGDLSGHDLPHPTDPNYVVSPTALEDWAICPHGYFVGRLLRVEPLEAPEEIIEISPIEVGNLVHEALDRFFTEQSEAGAVPSGDERWTPEQRAALDRTARKVADE